MYITEKNIALQIDSQNNSCHIQKMCWFIPISLETAQPILLFHFFFNQKMSKWYLGNYKKEADFYVL